MVSTVVVSCVSTNRVKGNAVLFERFVSPVTNRLYLYLRSGSTRRVEYRELGPILE
jgi:hypothetical protein